MADPDHRENVKRAVMELLRDSGLQMKEQRHGVLVTNPRDGEAGHIFVEFEDCHVSWHHVEWDYIGLLEGFEAAGHPRVTAQKIVDTLVVRS